MENIYQKTNGTSSIIQENWEEIKKQASNFLLNVKDERHVWLSSTSGKFKIDLILCEEEEFNFKKNITTHTLENGEIGTSGSVPEPFIINIRATVGELYWEEQNKINFLDTVQNGMNTLSAVSPSLSTQAQQYMNKTNNIINKVDNVINKVDNVVDFIDGIFNNENYKKQKKAFFILKNLFLMKIPININTFYGIFDNMSIKDLSIKNNNLTTSEINISLQQMNFVKIETKKINSPITETQKAKSVNNGIDRSTAKSIIINNR